MPLAYNKLCEIEDFSDETLCRNARELFPLDADGLAAFPVGCEHRKYWEVSQAARTLVDFGAMHGEAKILGVGVAGSRRLFWATKYVRRVFATDPYLDAGGWQETAPTSMLHTPGAHATFDWNERRLVARHMNALELCYEDRSFDGVFCSSSVESATTTTCARPLVRCGGAQTGWNRSANDRIPGPRARPGPSGNAHVRRG